MSQIALTTGSGTMRMTSTQPAARAQWLSSRSSSYTAALNLERPCAYGRIHTADRQSLVVRAGNAGTNGPFAPIVRVTRNAMGTKEFNQFRGKAISLHSQVIKEFGKSFGVDNKQVQGLIRLAKKNGEKLGFLA